MGMIRQLAVIGIIVGLILCSLTIAGSSELDEQLAIVAAENWLRLVDNGKYTESWDQSATYFKNAIKKDDWKRTVKAVREPLGNVISRSAKSQNYMTALPGAPDGKYVVIQFETSFTKKKAAIETITPMMDSDGKWRVSGYFIK
jgi:predicted SnoaL-like aldol condensation-catalyzing enzyme